MNLSTSVKMRRDPQTGHFSITRLSASKISALTEYLPTEAQVTQWAIHAARLLSLGRMPDLIHVKLVPEAFDSVVTSMYKRCGKNVTREGDVWRVPMKEGAFFIDIDRIVLYNDDYKLDTIVIHK